MILKGKKTYISFLLLAAVAGLIFALTDYIQWYGDSYLYRFDFGTGEPIETFWDIFPSQYAHYFMMNGRVWAHVLCQGFSAIWGQTAFAICNAMMYVAFVLAFVKTVGGSWRNIPTLLSCILIILFFSDTSYNANCQIGYIWTSAVTLVFISQYFKYQNEKRPKAWRIATLLLLSLLAGNGNEAIAIGVGAALITDTISKSFRLTLTQWIMLVGFGIGGLVLCLSPGILDRASGEGANPVYSTYRILVHSRALYLLIISVAILKIRRKLILRKFVSDNRFFFIALVTLIIFSYLIGVATSGRQLFGVELFSAILTVKAMTDRSFPKWMLILFSLVIIAIYTLKFQYLHDSNDDIRALRKEIEKTGDGIIYIDFKRYNALVKPTEVKDMQYSPLFFVYSIQDDINDRGLYYQSVRNGIDPPPYPVDHRVYPTVLNEILTRPDRNYTEKCADGTFFIVQDRRNPATFILHRRINILGFKIPISPYTVEFKDDYHMNIDSMNILLERFEIPLVENGEIEMTLKN